MTRKSSVVVGRVRLIFILIAIFGLGLVYRLYTVQIVHGEIYAARADRQYISTGSNLFNRGTVYFKNKSGEPVTAAYQQVGNVIALNPKLLEDADSAYNLVSAHIPIDQEDFYERAGRKDDPYEEIAKKVDVEIGDIISDSNIVGLQVYKQKWRTYPGNKLAANVIGLLAYKEDELAGRYGLEYQYEDVLKRTNNTTYANFFVEMFSNIKKTVANGGEGEGDIVTTIEPTAQLYLESVIEDVNEKWSSGYSGGIIMNPQTGEIIAMAQAPTFDPNDFSSETNTRVFSNRLVEDVYEMGSIIKPLTVAAGIDSGVITANTTYNDSGSLVLNGHKISNFDGKGRGVVDMQEVLSQSLNTGVAFISQKLGGQRFSEYLKSFGLDKKTNIDLPFEAAPLVENLNSPREIEHATASYGQGIAMTPIATIRALSVLANGGKLVEPHVVSEIKYKSGLSKKFESKNNEQVLKPESVEEVTRMLVEVVDDALLHGTVKLERYSVAAKTGTAQIPKHDGRGYYDDRYLHSFFGYFPAYDPKFIVFLFTYHPKGVSYASETLTHSFMDITKYLINYYEIPPDR